MPVVVKMDIYVAIVSGNGHNDSCTVQDVYDQVMIGLGKDRFYGEFKHLKGWCEDKGFGYVADLQYIKGEVPAEGVVVDHIPDKLEEPTIEKIYQ